MKTQQAKGTKGGRSLKKPSKMRYKAANRRGLNKLKKAQKQATKTGKSIKILFDKQNRIYKIVKPKQ